jgi:hypothetical protein
MKDHFVLLGPGVQKEGEGNTQKTTKHFKPTSDAQTDNSVHDTTLHAQNGINVADRSPTQSDVHVTEQVDVDLSNPDTSLVDAVSEGREGIDLLKTIRNKYLEDQFFKNIIEHPKEFKNFKVTEDGLLYLKAHEQRLLCIPKVITHG